MTVDVSVNFLTVTAIVQRPDTAIVQRPDTAIVQLSDTAIVQLPDTAIVQLPMAAIDPDLTAIDAPPSFRYIHVVVMCENL